MYFEIMPDVSEDYSTSTEAYSSWINELSVIFPVK
jgi:hypothetical protein